MLNEMRNGIVEKRGLSPEELSEIADLAAVVEEHDRILMKMNWNALKCRKGEQTDDFLYYDDGKLVGFLAMFYWNDWEVEITGMVHPEYRRKGIFTALLEQAKAELRGWGNPSLLFIVHAESESGKAFVTELGVAYDHSEYRMEMDPTFTVPALPERLEMREARPEDVEDLGRVSAVCFDLPLETMVERSRLILQDPRYRCFVALADGEFIGQIYVDLPGAGAFLLGFAVSPEHQGRGYGREMLSRTIRQCLAEGRTTIALEAAVENDGALGLYKSCGFETVSGYDYYRKSLQS